LLIDKFSTHIVEETRWRIHRGKRERAPLEKKDNAGVA
jgi:hypothetical protein